MYHIREVDGSDPTTGAILKTLHAKTFGNSAPQIDPTHGYWWLAYDEEWQPVAFAGMSHSATYSDAGYLTRSGVLPAHRGHGLQVRLLRAREAKAKRLGFAVIRTDTTRNTPSANSLIRAGFRLFDPKEPWAFENSLYWRKEL